MANRVLWLTFLALMTAVPHRVGASWAAMDPSALAAQCPVIVSGEIVEIREAAAKAGGRVLDVARIRITAVHKQLLRGVEAEVGGLIEARMHSRKDTIAESIDLRYPVGTKATWLLYLGDDRAFRINWRPEQCLREQASIKRLDLGPQTATLDGRAPFTVDEWIAARREKRHPVTAEEKAQQAKARAWNAAIRQTVRGLYDGDGVLQADRLPGLLRLPDETRSHLVNRSAKDLTVRQDDWVTIRCFLARKDPIENHRVRALPGWIESSEPAKRLVLESLRDKSPRMRLFACQAIKLSHAHSPEVTAAVATLLGDADREVRMMAVGALGRLGAREHRTRILTLYMAQKPTEAEAAAFGEALARLGHVDAPLACFEKAIASDNWNIRHSAVQILDHVRSLRVVPVVLAALPGELRRTIRDKREHHIDDRPLRGLLALLARRTGQKHGRDIVAWLIWWRTAAPAYGAKPVAFDQKKMGELQDQYRELFPR